MLKAVLFDLDQTLIDRCAAFRRGLEAELKDASLVDELLELDAGGYGDFPALLNRWSIQAQEVKTMESIGSLIADMLYPNQTTLTLLQRLSKSYELGVLTNGSIHNQTQKFLAAGLDRIFPSERFWISEALNMAKPDPMIFKTVCKEIGLSPHEVLYVGDHYENDILGASKVGLSVFHVPRVLDEKLFQEIVVRLEASYKGTA